MAITGANLNFIISEGDYQRLLKDKRAKGFRSWNEYFMSLYKLAHPEEYSETNTSMG